MNCTLCDEKIEGYNPMFNQLKIDEKHIVEICSECNQKIITWQQNTYAKLFPTKSAKKILDERKFK
jgi:hypothetical protein